MTHQLVIIRHGQSQWNLENRFTGWVDADLTSLGEQEAYQAAQLLAGRKVSFDLAYTSVQKRAIKTLWALLDGLNLHWLPTVKHWRLNERHYGALQGLNKAEATVRHGEAQVKIWRRSYDTPPPRSTGPEQRDARYAGVSKADYPKGESLKQVVARVAPYWQQTIWPEVQQGRRVLIVAHGNSLRALAMLLGGISEQEIVEFNIPTGELMLLTLDASGKASSMEFINDPQLIAQKQQQAASRARIKHKGLGIPTNSMSAH